MITIDRDWRAANPQPDHDDGTDKNSRGRVLVAGGSLLVPGALRLTGEAALRAGAGKARLATVAPAALGLGIAFPEAAVVALEMNEEGEIAAGAAAQLIEGMAHIDTLVLGPGMSSQTCAAALLAPLLAAPSHPALLLDAAAVACAGDLADAIRRYPGPRVFTPHAGEMAALTGESDAAIEQDPAGAALRAARRFGAIVVLKGGSTVIACPEGRVVRYPGGGVGLATGGSGDVLAGIIGGLLSRGMAPLAAAGWGVWLHGEAGRAVAAERGPIGFLARELLPEIPRLLAQG